MIDKTKIADVLTKTRLLGSPLVLLPLLIFGVWIPAIVVALLLILSDALDGYAARKYTPWASPTMKERGGKKDEAADGSLTVSMVLGVALNFFFFQNEPSWNLFWNLVAVCVTAQLITFALIIATAKLPMPWCKWVDIANGVYYGFLLAVASAVVLGNAFGWSSSDRVVWGSVLAAIVAAFVWFKRSKLFDRDESKYTKRPARA